MGNYKQTEEQYRAVQGARKEKGIKVIAFAGSGKTTTMKMIADDLCEQGMKGIYLAFNADIALEAKRKMPSGVEARTFHSLAYVNTPQEITSKMNNNKKFFPRNFQADFKVADFGIKGDTRKDKTKGKANDTIWISNYRQFIVVKAAMDKFLLDMTRNPQARHIVDSCEYVLKAVIDDDNKALLASRLLGTVEKLWRCFQDVSNEYAINPNVYLKLWALSKPTIDYDFILFDEAQDSDKLMLNILSHQKARVIYVGDPHQQIYEWRGAVNAMSSIKLPTYYLTNSFRFGPEIADYSGMLLSYLGETNRMTGIGKPGKVDTSLNYPTDIDAILCRTNIGAIEAVLEYAINTSVKVIPSNIDLSKTIELLHDIEKFRLKDPSLDLKKHFILNNFNNYEDMLKFCDESAFDTTIRPTVKLYQEYGYDKICEILWSAQDVHSNKEGLIVATTAHKSKGLEWDGVFIWDDFRTMMRSNEMQEYLDSEIKPKTKVYRPITKAEARLLYVTMTRAKERLYSRNVDVLIEYLHKTEGE